MQARRAMSWIGVRELGYSGADVARYLGVNQLKQSEDFMAKGRNTQKSEKKKSEKTLKEKRKEKKEKKSKKGMI